MVLTARTHVEPKASTLLVFGSAGQLATELALLAMPPGWRLIRLSRQDVDLRDSANVCNTIADIAPVAVINAAAYTAVDKAEYDRETARAVNAIAPTTMAEACARQGIPFLHVSTDYVFSGNKAGSYCEDDTANPLGSYGFSKLQGEEGVRKACPQHLILRTSWVFSPYGNNFVKTMLRLAAERDEVRVVVDQHGGPTAASDIAETLIRLAVSLTHQPQGFGTFHYSGSPATTWHGFAKAIFNELNSRGHRVPRLVPISSAQYPTSARRPANSLLDCSKLQAVHGIFQPSWPRALRTCLSRLLADANRRH